MSFFRNWFFMYTKATAAESAFEKKISMLGKPYRAQYPFPSLRRIVDFAFHLDKVLIEVDGASHEVAAQRRKDITTSIALEKRGWAVIPVH
jgi:very-short-patch-repair endonuclease